MRFWYITRVAIPSGAAQSVQINAMSKAFFDVLGDHYTLISTETEENKNFNTSFSWIRIPLVVKSKIQHTVLFSLKAFRILMRKASSKKDIGFTRDIFSALICLPLVKTMVYEIHKEPASRFADLLIRLFLLSSKSKLFAISGALENYCRSRFRVRLNQLAHYHDAVFIEPYEELRLVSKRKLRDVLGLPQNRFILLHSGSLFPGRGAEMFGGLCKNNPDITLIQVGGSDTDIRYWKGVYEDISNLIFFDRQSNENLIKFQLAADVLLFPMTRKSTTWWCSSPMKLFEYMASGIPILAAKIGPITEVLDENNGVFFKPGDVEDCSDKLVWIKNHLPEASKKGESAIELVRDKYQWKHRVNYIVNWLAQC